MTNIKIILAGGGTGGHVLPLVAIARAIKELNTQVKIYFVGPEEFSLDSLRQEGITIKKIIPAGKIRRYFSWLYLWEAIKLPLAFLQSVIIVAKINPDVVLGKGSYGSVLPVLAAKILGKKIILHESDVMPGLANKFLARWADIIIVSFTESLSYFRGPTSKMVVLGNPVRLEYLNLDKTQAARVLNFNPSKKVIFISGGSQGAQKINQVILLLLDALLDQYNLIWSVGSNNFKELKEKIGSRQNLKLAALLSEQELAATYRLCDLIIGRAGSGTIFEAAAFGKPSILIPLMQANQHQLFNAQAYALTGAALIIKESDLTEGILKNSIASILANTQIIKTMSQKAQTFAQIESANALAKILLGL